LTDHTFQSENTLYKYLLEQVLFHWKSSQGIKQKIVESKPIPKRGGQGRRHGMQKVQSCSNSNSLVSHLMQCTQDKEEKEACYFITYNAP
jgi:hypothetical protein